MEKFHNYVYGREVNIVTDHKPLVAISSKPLSKAPKRLRSMLLKCQDYNINLTYKQGTSIPVADMLSRIPSSPSNSSSPVRSSENVHNISNTAHLPFTKERFSEIKIASHEDPVLSSLKNVISLGWPDHKKDVNPVVNAYFPYRDELTVEDGIIMRGDRIVIPKVLRNDMKKKVHAGHTGINSCLRRARTYIFGLACLPKSETMLNHVISVLLCHQNNLNFLFTLIQSLKDHGNM